MPWYVSEDTNVCPVNKPYAVKVKGTGKKVACHESPKKAREQIKALYANDAAMVDGETRHQLGKHSQESHGSWSEGSTTYSSVSPSQYASMEESLTPSRLSSSEVGALTHYQLRGYHAINEVMRGEKDSAINKYGQQEVDSATDSIADIKSAFGKAKALPESTILHRGVVGIPETDTAELKEGSVFSDDAFFSTTMNPKIAEQFAGPGIYATVFRLKVPKGTKVLPVYDITGTSPVTGGEQELLLENNLAWKVTDTQYDPDYSNVRTVTMELITESTSLGLRDVRHQLGKHDQESHGNWSDGSSTAARDWQEVDYDSVVSNHTPKGTTSEEHAANTYRSPAYYYMNAISRGQTEFNTSDPRMWYDAAEYENMNRNLDSLIRKSDGLPHDAILHRGVDRSDIFDGLEPGDVFEEPAVMSTSSNKDWSENFVRSEGYSLELRVPKGTPAAAIDEYAIGQGREEELVLPRGTSWKVLEKSDKKNDPYQKYYERKIILELIPESLEDTYTVDYDTLATEAEVRHQLGKHSQESHGNWSSGSDSETFHVTNWKNIKETWTDLYGRQGPDIATPAQREAASFYQSSAYKPVNAKLRNTLVPNSDQELDLIDSGTTIDEVTQGISSAIDDSPGLPYNIELYRGISGQEDLEIDEGKVWHDPGFISTSIDKREAEARTTSGGGNHLLVLEVPEGTKALAPSNVTNYLQTEYEIILPPGMAWEVREKKLSSSGRVTKYRLRLVDVDDSRSISLEIRHQLGKHDQDSHGSWAVGSMQDAIVNLTVEKLAPGTEFAGEGWTNESKLSAAKGISKVKKKFPDAPQITSVETVTKDSEYGNELMIPGANGVAGVHPDDKLGRIWVHPNFHDKEYVANRAKQFKDATVAGRRVVVSPNPEDILVHEYGHVMEIGLAEGSVDLSIGLKLHEYKNQPVTFLGQQVPMVRVSKFAPSAYGTTSPDEWTAEYVTEYVLKGKRLEESSKYAKIANDVGGIFEKAYGSEVPEVPSKKPGLKFIGEQDLGEESTTSSSDDGGYIGVGKGIPRIVSLGIRRDVVN